MHCMISGERLEILADKQTWITSCLKLLLRHCWPLGVSRYQFPLNPLLCWFLRLMSVTGDNRAVLFIWFCLKNGRLHPFVMIVPLASISPPPPCQILLIQKLKQFCYALQCPFDNRDILIDKVCTIHPLYIIHLAKGWCIDFLLTGYDRLSNIKLKYIYYNTGSVNILIDHVVPELLIRQYGGQGNNSISSWDICQLKIIFFR